MVARVRIATFYINNVNKRLANLLEWLAKTKHDVACLQELKAEDKAFPKQALEAAGSGAVKRPGTVSLSWRAMPSPS